LTFFSTKNSDAKAAIDAWLKAEYPEYRPATSADLRPLALGESSGWCLPVSDDHTLVIGIDAAFPYSLPAIAIAGEKPLTGPHIEKQQKLCTFGESAEIDPDSPVAAVQAYLEHAIDLLAGNATGENDNDYRLDFEAYWTRDVTSREDVRYLIDVKAPSRIVGAEYNQRGVFLAEDADALRKWVAAHPRFNIRGFRGKAALIWLNELPFPDSYPTNLADLYGLVEAQAPEALTIMNELFAQNQKQFSVLLAGPSSKTRSSVGAIIAQRRGRIDRRNNANKADAPPHLSGHDYGFARVRSHAVDALRTRLNPRVYEALRGKHAFVIGCGSLGAGVARMLGQTGIGRLTLVDPESVEWSNLGRHELGVPSVGENKATELAAQLRDQLPHILRVDSIPKDWVTAAATSDDFFEGADIVVSTTGRWVAEAALNDFQRAGRVACPIIYGWMERRACAAHALMIGTKGSCFRCGFDNTGLPIEPATRWTGAEDNEQCAAPSSPYGAAELGVAQSLVATLTVDALLGVARPVAHRIWLAPTPQLEREGGAWSKHAMEWMGGIKSGGVMTASAWPEKGACQWH
jgi:molybdopterin/thiamine biosynthesis adenylyltransferase